MVLFSPRWTAEPSLVSRRAYCEKEQCQHASRNTQYDTLALLFVGLFRVVNLFCDELELLIGGVLQGSIKTGLKAHMHRRSP
jgi:hypothetical protein